jgi:hypothetical protein
MPKPAPAPISYVESLPQVRRVFQLLGDRVAIDAHWTLGRDFRTTVMLADLSPATTTFTVRNKWFRKSVLVGSIAAGVAVLLTRFALFHPVHWLSAPCWAVAGVSLVMAARSFQKRQFVRFLRKDGRPGLDVCRTDPARFDGFLRELQARLRRISPEGEARQGHGLDHR